MNLVVMEPLALLTEDSPKATLSARQALHLAQVLKVSIGSDVKCGVRGSTWKGQAIVASFEAEPLRVELRFPPEAVEAARKVITREDFQRGTAKAMDSWLSDPEHQIPTPRELNEMEVDLIIGLPRPKLFDRMLQYGASLRIRRMIFFCATRVEKSYFGSPRMECSAVMQSLQTGMEQGEELRPPKVAVFASWSRCLEVLKSNKVWDSSKASIFVADPRKEAPTTGELLVNRREVFAKRRAVIVIGPEGGFIDEELSEIEGAGAQVLCLGHHVLKSEVALVAAISLVRMGHECLDDEEKAPTEEVLDTNEGGWDIVLPLKGRRPQCTEERDGRR